MVKSIDYLPQTNPMIEITVREATQKKLLKIISESQPIYKRELPKKISQLEMDIIIYILI